MFADGKGAVGSGDFGEQGKNVYGRKLKKNFEIMKGERKNKI